MATAFILTALGLPALAFTGQKNERILYAGFNQGDPIRAFSDHEVPLLHQRVFASEDERNRLKAHLAAHGVFTSVHWPTHPRVLADGTGAEVAEYFAHQSLAVPVGSEYGPNDMNRVVELVRESV